MKLCPPAKAAQMVTAVFLCSDLASLHLDLPGSKTPAWKGAKPPNAGSEGDAAALSRIDIARENRDYRGLFPVTRFSWHRAFAFFILCESVFSALVPQS
jgi:hypothetical protein